MEPFSEQSIKDLKERILNDRSLSSDINKLLDFLPNCEYELILYMVQKNVWKGPVPLPPKDFKPGEGKIEFGLFLYWFHNPNQLQLDRFSDEAKVLILGIISILVEYLQDTKLNKENYEFFNKDELIYIDGTVLSTKTYATYDQGWFIAFLNLFISLFHNLWYNNYEFPTTPPQQISLSGAVPNTVSIALLGDWGAGDQASKEVMKRIDALSPDYIVHVGDVYYAGTPLESSPHGTKYLSPGEEYQNLLDLWPQSYVGKSFTLNSNHEMYSGANGLFYDALGVSNNYSTPFNAQKGASCFAMEYCGWTLLGLDSAFTSPMLSAFMTGSIGASTGFQRQWIKGLEVNPEQTIVFTHHNGFADDCTFASPLWAEINDALNGDPYAWYWGHVHNGIVYDAPITIPSVKGKPSGFTTNTFSRCLGHAALPYGVASSLVGKPITWKANSPKPSPSKELYNGFAILTLTSLKGQLTGITESFYDASDKAQPVYSKQLF